MPKPRKTIKVAEVLRMANIRLGVSDMALQGLDGLTPQQAFRRGMSSLLEGVLHETNTYAGFGYQETPYVEGVTDESKRVYRTHQQLTTKD